MEKDAPGGDKGLHAPVEFRLIQLLGGFLQVELLTLQPGGGGKDAVLGQGARHLGGRPGGLLHHQVFQPLEVGAARVAGKPGDGGVREAQPLGQLADGGEEEGVGVGVDVVQNFLLRPGQFPG